MSRRTLLAVAASIALAAANCLAQSPSAADARNAGVTDPEAIQFWRAVHTASTQVPFVLIHVVRPNGSTDTYATSASLLLGAVHIEHHLPYTAAGEARAIALAISTPGRIFRFRRRAALQNIGRYYDSNVLQEIRDSLRRYSDAELLAGFAVGGSLHDSYSRFQHPKAHAYEFAVAHVLLERGLLPSMHSQIHVVE